MDGEGPSLRELEERLFALITAPEGVTESLRALGSSSRGLERIVRSDARGSAALRLDIYAHMYFFRLRDTLREIFPRLFRLVGEAPFHNLVTDYLLHHPSHHPSLRSLGAQLPSFLATEGDEARPWLSELARLEWTRHDLFDGPDAAPLTLEMLRALHPDAFGLLSLELIPCHARMITRFAVDKLWQTLSEEAEALPPPPAPEERTLLIWRKDTAVLHRPIARREADALALVGGESGRGALSFGLLCDFIVERTEEGEDPAQVAFSLLGQWASDQLLVAPTPASLCPPSDRWPSRL